MELTSIDPNFAIYAGMITGIIQVIKAAVPEKAYKYMGLLAIVMGIALGIALLGLPDGLSGGIMIGLAASGLWSTGKAVIRKTEESKTIKVSDHQTIIPQNRMNTSVYNSSLGNINNVHPLDNGMVEREIEYHEHKEIIE